MSELVDDYNSRIAPWECLLSIARATSLQKEALAEMEIYRRELTGMKGAAIKSELEHAANVLLGCECALDSLRSEIAMLVLLKAEEPEKAWDCLIDAQNACAAAQRTDAGFCKLRSRSKHLSKLEKLIFPPQSFMSAGLIVGSSDCSICQSEYGTCSHVAGIPYMGVFCSRIMRKIVGVDHVALVDKPDDKRCRVVSFNVPQGRRNKMTWLIEPIDDTLSSEEDRAHTMEAIIMRAD